MKNLKKLLILLFVLPCFAILSCKQIVYVYKDVPVEKELTSDDKEKIFEEILAGESAKKLLEKLSTEKKSDILDIMLTDDIKNSVYSEKLTDTEKEKIFNYLLEDKRINETFLSLLTEEEKLIVYNGELTSEKKSLIFEEIFTDKRTNGNVVGLLNDTEKESVFDALLQSKLNVDFIKEILNKEENKELRKSIKTYLVSELTQEELKGLLNNDSKSSIFEEILAGKTAEGLLEKLSVEQKVELLEKFLTDEVKNSVYAEKLTDSEKVKIFNEVLSDKRISNTFLGLLSDTEKQSIYEEKLTPDEKVRIFNEIFTDKRTSDKVVELLNDTEKEVVFDILLKEKASVDFIKEILNKPGNEEIRNTIKEYLITELTQAELQALLDTKDIIAPSAVTNFSAENTDASAHLSWTDAPENDVLAYEITYNSESSSRAVSFSSESIIVPQGVQNAYISGLTNGKTYNFSIKTIDTTGNKSSPVSISVDIKIIENQPLVITLIPDVTIPTNKNIEVTVSVETSKAEVKSMAYKISANNDTVDSVFENGTLITESSKFTATDNGIFCVAVQDTAGRRELKRITIGNIDRKSPDLVNNLVATYNSLNKKISLTWIEPTDSDYSKVVISYLKSDVVIDTVEKLKGTTSFALENIEADNSEYTFMIRSMDIAGNVSAYRNVSVFANSGAIVMPEITSLTVDRIHLTGTQTERNVNVTITGSNFDLIAEQSVPELKIQFVDGTSVTNYTANVDTVNNRATAVISIPSVSNATTNGKDFIIQAKLCGVIDELHTAKVNVSASASINSITLVKNQYALSEITEDSKLHVRITGTNLDLLPYFDMRLDGVKVVFDIPTTLHATSFEGDIKIPSVEGLYNVDFYSDPNVGWRYSIKELEVYDVPKFNSFSIPEVGNAADGNQVTATVKGTSFTASGVTANSFELSCLNPNVTKNAEITVVDYSTLSVKLIIPPVAGNYAVTISCGGYSETANMIVLDTNKGYTTGDIIYNDGTVSSKNEDLISGKVPAAIFIAYDQYGIQYTGLSIKESSSGMRWNSGANPSTYPPSEYADQYGKTAGLRGELLQGWYMPSVAEFTQIYNNKTVLDSSLAKCNGDLLNDKQYWTSAGRHVFSNQYALVILAQIFNFYNGTTAEYQGSSNEYKVRCIRVFN